VHLHDLRARGASFLLTKLELPMVAAISGHKRLEVMQRRYARLLPEEIHAAVEKRNIAERCGTSSSSYSAASSGTSGSPRAACSVWRAIFGRLEGGPGRGHAKAKI
jgi:hypothetical protein